MRRERLLLLSVIAIGLIISPSYIRAYMVVGNSDGPAYITGDRVLVNLSSYDIKLPYTDKIIRTVGHPLAGDYVLYRHIDGTVMIKRIVASPGSKIEMVNNHLKINDQQLLYQSVDPQMAIKLFEKCQLGDMVEREIGNGPDIIISYSGTEDNHSSFMPQQLPEGMYFILGANRDYSLDSRHFGLVPRESILGKVIGKF